MESDDLRSRIPLKRSRSPSIAPANEMQTGPTNAPPENDRVRQPKRQRKNKDIPEYDARPDDHVLKRMDRSNPLSRKTLKREAKRARKAHRIKDQAAAGLGGMEVDNAELQFTFMA